MRKRKHSRNTKEYMLLRNGSIFIFICIFILIGTGYSLLFSKLEITCKATMNVVDPEEPVDLSKSVASIKNDGSWGDATWGGKYILESLSITNNDELYESWEISFDLPVEVDEVQVNTIQNTVITVDGKHVKIVKEKAEGDWSATWELGAQKNIQIQFKFTTNIDELYITNLMFNNKLITEITGNNVPDTSADESKIINTTNEDTNSTTNSQENNVSTENNVVENNTAVNNVVEKNNNTVENSTVENDITENVVTDVEEVVDENVTKENNIENVTNTTTEE